MTRGSADANDNDPWGVAEGGGEEVRHPIGVEVKTLTFPQVIAAVAARPVAMERGSLAGSGIPYMVSASFCPPCGQIRRCTRSGGGDWLESKAGEGELERELVGGPRRAGAGRPTRPIEPGPIR